MLKEFCIDKKHNSTLDEQTYYIFDKVKNVWIAGGFARRIYEYFHTKNKSMSTSPNINNYILNLYDENVDIDFFYNNIDDLTDTKSLLDKVATNKNCFSHMSPFADNYNFSNNSYRPDYTRPSYIQRIQLINKFFFEDINNCLNSFDFEVCKFALNKINGTYRIYYTDQAVIDNRYGQLNISKVGSPFLPSRINKYFTKYNMSFQQSENNLEKIKEYCYKVVSGRWNINEFYVDNKYLFRQVKTLHKHKKLSKEELSIMIGMFEDIVRHSNPIKDEDYYYFEETKTDWACKELLSEY